MRTVGEAIWEAYIWKENKGPLHIGTILRNKETVNCYVGFSGNYYSPSGLYLVWGDIESVEIGLLEKHFRQDNYTFEKVDRKELGKVGDRMYNDLSHLRIYRCREISMFVTLMRKRIENEFYVLTWQPREEYENFLIAFASVGGLEHFAMKRKPLEPEEISTPKSPWVLKMVEKVSEKDIEWDGHKDRCYYVLKEK
jgi:hypothetical protein